MTGAKIRAFKEVRKGNSLVGFAEVQMPSGLIFHDVAVHQRDGRCWASPPAKPMIGRDGLQMRDANGKGLYTPIISFSSKDLRDAFSDAVVNAVRAQRPELLP